MTPLFQRVRLLQLFGFWLLSGAPGFFLGNAVWGATLETKAESLASPNILLLQDGTITARLANLSLRQVMAEFSRVSGAQVRWLNAGGEEAVSIEFHTLPLDEAFRRMLPAKNFLLWYASTPNGLQLSQIWITSTGGRAGAPAVRKLPALMAEVDPAIAEAHTSEEAALAAAQPEEAYDDATALDMALEQVTSAANSSVRMETIELLESRVQEDPRVRAILVQLAYDSSDPEIQQAANEALERLQ